jgi:hypothetical protein
MVKGSGVTPKFFGDFSELLAGPGVHEIDK